MNQKKSSFSIFALAVFACAFSIFTTGAAAQEYNARDEFALTQGGANGLWNYGYSTSDANNTLNLFTSGTNTDTVAGCSGGSFERWLIKGGDEIPSISRHNPALTCQNVPSNAVFIHPGSNNQRAVLRFNAPASGTFQITGSFQKQNPSATTDLRIIKNAATAGETVLFTGAIGAVYQQAFDLTVTLAAGDKIDFSVGDGDANSYFGDGSSIAITIGQPVTACLTAPANLQVFVPAENSPTDVQSNNANASLVGDATYTNAGKVSRAFEFDGSGDYVRIEDNAAQRPATAVTVEGWFKFDTVGGIVSLVSKPVRGSAFNSYTLYLEGGQLRGLTGNASQYTRALSSFTPQTGVWHHLAFTYDFSGGVSTLKLYANGADVTSSVDGTANLPLYYDTNPYPLLIGADFENDNPTFFLDGQADEISIYGRALAQTEIFDIVQQGSFGKCSIGVCVQPPNNLVSWYQGEQNALDAKSNNHGTLQNGTTFQSAKVGQGFKFDGVDDAVSIPDASSLKPQNITVETWVKFDSLSSNTSGAPNGWQYLVFKKNSRAANFEGYSLLKTSDNRLAFLVTPASGAAAVAESGTTTVTTGTFYHVVGTYDGTQARLFINGNQVGSASGSFALDYDTRPIYLGTSGESSFDGKFNGVLDEVSIYNRALTAAEISSIYNAGASGKCETGGLNPAANQIAWYSGDGDARDFTGLNSAGTLRGDTRFRVGRVGQAFGFDGSGDYISTADSANWDFGTGDFAVEGWFNAPNPTGVQRIISAGSMADGANNLWSFGYGDIGAWGGGQRLNFAVFNGGGYSDFSSNQVAFRPNTWHHAAVVRSGSSFTFYLDGVAVGTIAVGTGFAVNGGSTGAIIGARYNNDPATIFEFASGMLDEISIYKRALSESEIAAVYNAGFIGKAKSDATTVADPTAQLTSATVTFASVTADGITSQSGVDPASLPALPAGATFTGLAYEISTTATYRSGTTDDVRVCFNLPALASIGASNLRVYHLENNSWIDRTAVNNTLSNFCTDNLTSLSPFAIVQALAPTAATATVSGRVMNGRRGVRNVLVTLTEADGASRTILSGNDGRYSFANVEIGQTVVVKAQAKRYTFTPDTQIVTVTEDADAVDFAGSAFGFSPLFK